MYILVDYDNIEETDRRKGIQVIIDRLVRGLGLRQCSKDERIMVRLYGGWYEGKKPTKVAQKLVADILCIYPDILVLKEEDVQFEVRVNVELAYALVVDPTKHLFSTFRTRGTNLGNVYFKDPDNIDCEEQRCPMKLVVRHFFDHKKCPSLKCSHVMSDFLYKNEQKLIDSMIVSDLIFMAVSKEEQVFVLSSDDDIMPAIQMALYMGMSVTHIHTKNRRVAKHYSSIFNAGYIEKDY